MADSIVRLRVDSQEYDNKLKRAAEGLNRYIEGCRKAGGTLEHVDDGVLEFTRSLSKMDTVANNTKGKLNEMTNAFTELTMEYNRMTDAEKNNQFGRALNAELEQMKRNIISTKQEMASIQGSLSGGSGFKDVLNGVAGKFGMSASMFTGVGAAVAGAAGAFKLLGDNINLAMNFEKSMSQLSSLTGMVGKDLDQLKEYAIELGSTSTLTASQVADAFRLIGSQQPQLLESGQALKEVTKYAITLSEAAGIDLQTAAQTLSTSINQMGGDSNNAARYVNVLAAASQKGAGDIAWLGEAITKAATAAKAVGTDYEELVANLEQLAKAGFDASTAGTALRSIIMNLEKQANNEFKPSVVGLTQAFENLGKANLDIVGYQQIAGKMFASQAMALANAAQEAKNMTTAITGTNTAMEQASTNTANLDGAMKSLSSAWEGFNLHINSSSGFLKDCVDWAAELIRKLDGVATAGGRAAKALQQMNGAGGSAGPTKVDQQINALKGSNHKRAAFNLTMQSYRQQLADYDQKIANGGKWESKDKPGFFHYENVDILKAQRAALAQMAKEFQTRGLRELNYTTSTSTGNKGKATLNIEVEVDDDEGEKSLDSLKAKLKELKKLRDEAINKKDFKARDTYNAQIKQVNAEIKSLRGGSTTTTTKQPKTEIEQNQAKIKDLTLEYIKLGDQETEASKNRQIEIQKEIELLQKRNNLLGVRSEQAQGKFLGGDVQTTGLSPAGYIIDRSHIFDTEGGIGWQKRQKYNDQTSVSEYKWRKKENEKEDKQNKKDEKKDLSVYQDVSRIAGSVQGMLTTLEQLGIKIPDELKGIMSGVQSIIEFMSATSSFISAVSGIKMFGLAHGGMIKAYSGTLVGNTYSGDQLRGIDNQGQLYGLNAGEVVLNRAQTGNIASQLSGNNGGGQNAQPFVTGDIIYLGLQNYLQENGYGKIVTTNMR